MSLFFRRASDGSFRVGLGREEREALKWLTAQMRELLTDAGADGDPALDRLFPPAYGPDEAQKNAEYAQLMREELRKGRLGALDLLAATAEAESVTEDELTAWMGALNDVRLVLGTRLDVTEDMHELDDDDPRAPMFELYQYLTLLQGDVIDALQESG